MDDLQLVFLVLGAVAIVAVLVHGFWSIRKQQPKSMKESPMANFYKDQAERRDAEGFDNDGIGAVRVRKANEVEPPVIKPIFKNAHAASKAQAKPVTESALEPTVDIMITEDNHTMANKSEPTLTALDDDIEFSQHEALTSSTQHHDTAAELNLSAEQTDSGYQDEPQFSQDLSKETDNEHSAIAADEQPSSTNAQQSAPLADPTDVLVLHVVAKQGEQLQGAELLPALLSLNFKFGDMDIFHRHIDNAGTGNVLFSLANMMKPGVFDPDHMEQFVTEGVVLFMTIPCYGDPKMNFTIMLNSALQLADDLGAEVLDGKRLPWDDAAKQDYKRRIEAA
jgi:cell division protein ZipA